MGLWASSSILKAASLTLSSPPQTGAATCSRVPLPALVYACLAHETILDRATYRESNLGESSSIVASESAFLDSFL